MAIAVPSEGAESKEMTPLVLWRQLATGEKLDNSAIGKQSGSVCKELSVRQVNSLQERRIAGIVVQGLQERINSRSDNVTLTLGKSSVQPLERLIGLVSESINRGDQVKIPWVILRNQLAQGGF